jgi:isochorismate hydrolase
VKKEAYFTADSIDQLSQQMKGEVTELARKHRFKILPEKTALLILDMQQFFLDNSSHAFIPSSTAIVPRVTKLSEAFSRLGLPVFFTRHLNSAADAQMMSEWWRDLIQEKNPFSQISPEFNPDQGTVITKCQYDAFYQTCLEETLQKMGVSQLVICGVMTHLCCESTARSAFIRGFEVFFSIDGTATYTEGFHWASLLNLAHGFAIPVLVADILSALSGKIED